MKTFKQFLIEEFQLSNKVKLVDKSNPNFPDSPEWKMHDENGNEVGGISLHHYTGIGHTIAQIDVRNSHRGQGLGGLAVKALAKHYGKLSSDPQGNTSNAAKKMWERLGAKKVSTDKNTKGYHYQIDG